MPRRGENIHKRKDGRWEGRYSKGRKPDGTISYGSVYGKTYQEAKEKLAYARIHSEQTGRKKRSDCSFQELLSLWMENNRLRYKGATASKYQYLIDAHILPELGRLRLTAVSAASINGFLARKLHAGRLDHRGGLSSAYVRSIMQIISSALKFAVEEQLCPPLRTPISKPQIARKDLAILSAEEQKRLERYLLETLDHTGIGILLSLYAGLRIGEVCALTWEDIDLDARVLSVRHTISRVRSGAPHGAEQSGLIIDTPKTRTSARDIPIFSQLYPVLLAAQKTAVSDYVVSEKEGFLSPRTFDYRYHRRLQESGVKQVNYHALRHTFATRCIEAGMDAKSLSELLGHSNVVITLNTYVHSSMDMKRSQLEKLAAFSL